MRSKQLNALLWKSLAYQRKNWCLNCNLIAAPIVIAALLGILQVLINNLLSDQKCQCECLSCEIGGEKFNDSAMCNNVANDDLECLERNDDNCGPQYSDQDKIPFCPIENPSKWPPLFELTDALDPPPKDAKDEDYEDEESTGGPNGGSSSGSGGGPGLGRSLRQLAPAAAPGAANDAPSTLKMLYTSENSTFADAVMAQFFRQPNASGLVAAGNTVQEAIGEIFSLTSADLSFLSRLPWDIGSYNEGLISLYLDQAFFDKSRTVAADCGAAAPAFEAFNALLGGGLQLPWLQKCANGVAESAPSVEAVNDLLYCTSEDSVDDSGGPDCPRQLFFGNAFDWRDSSPGTLRLDIWHNDFQKITGENENGITTFKRISKAIDRAVNEFLKQWLGSNYTARLLAMMDMPKGGSELSLDFSSFLGPLFFLIAIQLPLPIALSQLVYEKEHRLRSMMRMHGLQSSVYIAVTYLYLLIVHILFMAVLIIAGAAAQLEFFLSNSIGVQIVFYFLFSNVQIAFAFLISTFFRSARSATVVAFFLVIGVPVLANFLLEPFFIEQRWFTILVELIPAFGAMRGLWELSQYSFRAVYRDSEGMQFSDLWSEGNGMGHVLVIFLVEWPVFMLLAWYLDQVLDSGVGVRRHPLFCFRRAARSKKVASSSDEDQAVINVDGLASDDGPSLSRDALRERDAAYRTEPSADAPVVVRDLRKVYPPVGGNPRKVAVSNLSMTVARGECFGLLGPNGAGKSTSIHMMIGFIEANGGEAFINGHNISTDMDEIYRSMGVCPQHDLLWEMLTAQEHLYFYARLKGLRGKALKEAVEVALKAVSLQDVGRKRVGKFSGGMKRRLSVAISLIGNPSVVYLDEPSTGLDPSARRNLWNVVQAANQNKAVILTTHSMEEAEVLCDRLGIFVDGRLVCIGNPKQLTARFGGYYVFNITVSDRDGTRVADFVGTLSRNAKCTYHLGSSYKYEIPCKDISLSEIFTRVDKAQAEGLAILDWGVHNASLEDVFIKLATKAAAQG